MEDNFVPTTPEVMTFSQVENIGKNNPSEIPNVSDAENLFSIIFTSGTTSATPKGVMHSRISWKIASQRLLDKISIVSLSFSPLAHSSPRRTLLVFLLNGGRTGFYNQVRRETCWNDYLMIFPSRT